MNLTPSPRQARIILGIALIGLGSVALNRATTRYITYQSSLSGNISGDYPSAAGVWHSYGTGEKDKIAFILNKDGTGVIPDEGKIEWQQSDHTISFSDAIRHVQIKEDGNLSDDGTTLVLNYPDNFNGPTTFLRGTPQ